MNVIVPYAVDRTVEGNVSRRDVDALDHLRIIADCDLVAAEAVPVLGEVPYPDIHGSVAAGGNIGILHLDQGNRRAIGNGTVIAVHCEDYWIPANIVVIDQPASESAIPIAVIGSERDRSAVV